MLLTTTKIAVVVRPKGWGMDGIEVRESNAYQGSRDLDIQDMVVGALARRMPER